MKISPVYQTIEDRNNPNEVEANGPILGEYKPWLGVGYYFWDGFIDNAHWWGEAHVKKDYMICHASIEVEDDYILDLHGNPEHMQYFSKTLKLVADELKKDKLTISEAFAYLRKKSESFVYKVIRAESPDCGSPTETYPFVDGHKSRLNLIKPIQICAFDKNCVVEYTVIYPDYYNHEWLG